MGEENDKRAPASKSLWQVGYNDELQQRGAAMIEPIDFALFAFLIFGLFTSVIFAAGRRVKRLRGVSSILAGAFQTLNPAQKTPEPKIITPYDELKEDEVDKIVSNIIGVLTVVGATYGILFALVTSEKASMAFSSWAFVIWSGWVLALLMRICNCGAILLGDYHLWDRGKRNEALYGISKFAEHSAYLLVPTASFVPLFAIMKTISLDEIVAIYPWGQDTSLFLGVFSIASVAVFFYAFVLAMGRLTRRQYGDIFTYVVILLWGIGLTSVSLSPLTPVTSKIVGFFLFEPTVPSIVAVLVSVVLSMVGLLFGLFVIIGLLVRMVSMLYKNVRNRRS